MSTEISDRRRRGGKKRDRARKGTSRTQHRGEGTPAGTNMGAVARRRGRTPPGTQTSGHVDESGLTQPLASAGISFPEVFIRAEWALVSSGLQSVNIDATNGRPGSQSGGHFVHPRERGVRHHWVCVARGAIERVARGTVARGPTQFAVRGDAGCAAHCEARACASRPLSQVAPPCGHGRSVPLVDLAQIDC